MRNNVLKLILFYLCFYWIAVLAIQLPDALNPALPSSNLISDPTKAVSFITGMLYVLCSFTILEKHYYHQPAKSVAYLFASIILLMLLRYIIDVLLAYLFDMRIATMDIGAYFTLNIFHACFFTSFGIVYYFFQFEQRRKTEEKIAALEKQNIQIEFLQSQLNPHFLFNALNNIYSQVYHNSEHSLEAISRLSELLRYIIYGADRRVNLETELELLKKYIELQKLSIASQVQILIDAENASMFFPIPPLLLITFMENAFKHGDIKHNGTHILMRLSGNEKRLCILVENKKKGGMFPSVPGVGIINAKKRLDLLYPQCNLLNINDQNDIFTVNLTLEIE